MRIFLLFVMTGLALSCQKNEDLLTNKSWFLYIESIGKVGINEDKSYYKLSDSAMVLLFNNNGMVDIMEKREASASPYMLNNDKNTLTFNGTEYHISKLSETELSISHYDINANTLKFLMLYTSEHFPEDGVVETLRLN